MTDLSDFIAIPEERTEVYYQYHLIAQCKTPEEAAAIIARARRDCNFEHTVISGRDPSDPSLINVLYQITKERKRNGSTD